jgi:hypothetical protein
VTSLRVIEVAFDSLHLADISYFSPPYSQAWNLIICLIDSYVVAYNMHTFAAMPQMPETKGLSPNNLAPISLSFISHLLLLTTDLWTRNHAVQYQREGFSALRQSQT